MAHRFQSLGFGLVAIVVLTSVSAADVLYLKRGGRLEGVLTVETATRVTLDVGMGQVSVPRASILRIERKESALSEYRARFAALQPGDVAALANLARFAGEHGLRSESRAAWARVASLDPGNVEAHLALGHVLVGGTYVDEDEAYRSRGFVNFDGRWMTPAEQASLLRERERRADDDRRVDEARRTAREADDRARRAESDASRARAEAAREASSPAWGYGGPVIVGSPHWGGSSSGCYGSACTTVPPLWPAPPPAPVATPIPRAQPLRPSSIR